MAGPIHVFKFGSAILREGAFAGETLNTGRLRRWVEVVKELHNRKHGVIWVTSAAIALGSRRLSMTGKSLVEKQALAAVGQIELMRAYQELFSTIHLPVAQVLLTHDDLANPKRLELVRNTLLKLLELHILPIINENDTTSTEEITFGDNDRLSALVAELVGASELVILSNVQGLYDRSPKDDPQAKVLKTVEVVNEDILQLAADKPKQEGDLGTGGMQSKLKAAQYVTERGITAVIAHGDSYEVGQWLLDRKKHPGTVFKPCNSASQKKDRVSIDVLMSQLVAMRPAQHSIAGLGECERNNVLLELREELCDAQTRSHILKVNERECAHFRKNVTNAFLDRMTLTESRFQGMADQLKGIASLPDPLEPSLISTFKNAAGLVIQKHRVPLGCVGMIYESRPNVIIDAFGLCFKAGNAVFLRSGSESFETSKALLAVIHKVLQRNGLPVECVQLPPSADRAYVLPLLKASSYLDLMIPRGGEDLIRFVQENSRIPIVKHDKGICHLFVHEKASLEMAVSLLLNGKIQRPGVCNALETLLVDEKIANQFVPMALKALMDNGVECRVESSLFAAYQSQFKGIKKASELDWDTEYLDLILSIRTVKGLDGALAHIEKHGSKHSEAIATEDKICAEKFLSDVDASAVFWNASTRFNDGFEFGLGTEMGISTQKLHVRGPMGIEALTTTKFKIFGRGHIRS